MKMRDIKLTYFPKDNNWVEGVIDDKPFWAKLYDVPSCYGIDEGRVSKLKVGEGWEVNYDRGWDCGEDDEMVPELVDFLNNTPKRFS
jgi:hypothetical protein